jgi:hypothetical protein
VPVGGRATPVLQGAQGLHAQGGRSASRSCEIPAASRKRRSSALNVSCSGSGKAGRAESIAGAPLRTGGATPARRTLSRVAAAVYRGMCRTGSAPRW